MSTENLYIFKALCNKDNAIKARVQTIGIDNFQKLVKFAADELDLDITIEEMSQLAAEQKPSLVELNDNELEKVAGGKWIIPKDEE